MINGIHHVSMKYENEEMLEKALDFYCNILGLEEKLHWGEGEKRAVMLKAGDVVVEMFATGRKSAQTGSVNHFAFATDRVDECIEAVRAAGYQVTVEPKDVNLGGRMPARVAFCIGPGGEEIEFFHEISFDA